MLWEVLGATGFESPWQLITIKHNTCIAKGAVALDHHMRRYAELGARMQSINILGVDPFQPSPAMQPSTEMMRCGRCNIMSSQSSQPWSYFILPNIWVSPGKASGE
jgi:hypothetical protein